MADVDELDDDPFGDNWFRSLWADLRKDGYTFPFCQVVVLNSALYESVDELIIFEGFQSFSRAYAQNIAAGKTPSEAYEFPPPRLGREPTIDEIRSCLKAIESNNSKSGYVINAGIDQWIHPRFCSPPGQFTTGINMVFHRTIKWLRYLLELRKSGVSSDSQNDCDNAVEQIIKCRFELQQNLEQLELLDLSDMTDVPDSDIVRDKARQPWNSRSAIRRNLFWLSIRDKMGTSTPNVFGAIRDHWNEMSDDERKEFAPHHRTIGTGKSGWEVVRKGIEAAERHIENNGEN